MRNASFWTYFTSSYGICWLIIFVVALVGQTNIQTGEFGLFGFPIIALVYAFIRRSNDKNALEEDYSLLSPNLRKFLVEHPEFINAPMGLRDKAFHLWLVKGGDS